MIRSIAKLAFIVLLLGHGLIYLLGFLKAFDLAQVNELTQEISRPLPDGSLRPCCSSSPRSPLP